MLTIIDISSIIDTIASSLHSSKDNWEDFLPGEGVLSQFLKDNDIKDKQLLEKCKIILHENIKLTFF